MIYDDQKLGAFVFLYGCCVGADPAGVSCGCGNPEFTAGWILSALEAQGSKDYLVRAKFWESHPKGSEQILAHTLDRMRLLEHGSSWNNSWLTDLGKRLALVLRHVADNEGFEAWYEARTRGGHGCYALGGRSCVNCAALESFRTMELPSE